MKVDVNRGLSMSNTFLKAIMFNNVRILYDLQLLLNSVLPSISGQSSHCSSRETLHSKVREMREGLSDTFS